MNEQNQQLHEDRRDLFGKGCWTHHALPPGCQCPDCDEWRVDLFVWVDDDHVRCDSCESIYNPSTRKVVGYRADACLGCGEERPSRLKWLQDGRVRCTACGTLYNPGTGELHGPMQEPLEGGHQTHDPAAR